MDTEKNIPSINSLHKERNIKEQARVNVFNIVLKKCVEKILYTNKHTEHTYIYFEVPEILIGVTSYDMKSCINFLLKKLTEAQYKVLFIDPFYLYVDWGTNISSSNVDLQKYIPTSNPEKLKRQTKELLKKFPNTSKVVFEYENTSSKNKKK